MPHCDERSLKPCICIVGTPVVTSRRHPVFELNAVVKKEIHTNRGMDYVKRTLEPGDARYLAPEHN